MSLDTSLELVAAQSHINQCRICDTCNCMLSRQCSERGGGEVNLVNWMQTGRWVVFKASGDVDVTHKVAQGLDFQADD